MVSVVGANEQASVPRATLLAKRERLDGLHQDGYICGFSALELCTGVPVDTLKQRMVDSFERDHLLYDPDVLQGSGLFKGSVDTPGALGILEHMKSCTHRMTNLSVDVIARALDKTIYVVYERGADLSVTRFPGPGGKMIGVAADASELEGFRGPVLYNFANVHWQAFVLKQDGRQRPRPGANPSAPRGPFPRSSSS